MELELIIASQKSEIKFLQDKLKAGDLKLTQVNNCGRDALESSILRAGRTHEVRSLLLSGAFVSIRGYSNQKAFPSRISETNFLISLPYNFCNCLEEWLNHLPKACFILLHGMIITFRMNILSSCYFLSAHPTVSVILFFLLSTILNFFSFDYWYTFTKAGEVVLSAALH